MNETRQQKGRNMSARDDAERMAAELMKFRHEEDAEPPTGVQVNGVEINVDEDSTMSDLTTQILNAQNKG